MVPDPVSQPDPIVFETASPSQTDRLGARLGRVLGTGDTVLLSGPLGAGKSHLCRAIIRAALGDPMVEVPSPSYTLVNVYDGPGFEIWHADLYRLGDPEEVLEIGLDDAAPHALVLVEWPDRWATPPARRLELAMTPGQQDQRRISVHAFGAGWGAATDAMGVQQ